MKMNIIGDLHFRHQLPYASAVEDGRKAEWSDIKDKVIETAERCDVSIILGDVFNLKHNHSAVNAEFVDFLQRFPKGQGVHIISGNHDRFGRETSIDFIKALDNPLWHVYTEPELVEIKGHTIQMLPFMTPGTLEAKNLEEAQEKLPSLLKSADFLFHHHIADGTLWSQTAETTDLHEVYIPQESLSKYKMIVGGHIHKRQWVKDNILVTGNIFTNEVGEHDKAIFVLDTDSMKTEEIKLPCRGIYKIEMKKGDPLPPEIPDNSIVKIVCTDPEFGRQAREAMEALGCDRFDAYVIVEKYPRKRQKISIGEAGSLDFSLDNLVKVYAKARKVVYSELLAGLELLENEDKITRS